MIALLWAAVVVALVVMLAACGWMLVRKFIRLLEAVADLLVKPAILDGVHRPEPEERPLPAVLQPRAVIAARYRDVALARQERTHARRMARRERALALIAAQPRELN